MKVNLLRELLNQFTDKKLPIADMVGRLSKSGLPAHYAARVLMSNYIISQSLALEALEKHRKYRNEIQESECRMRLQETFLELPDVPDEEAALTLALNTLKLRSIPDHVTVSVRKVEDPDTWVKDTAWIVSFNLDPELSTPAEYAIVSITKYRDAISWPIF